MRTSRFPSPIMTKAKNRLAFTMWLAGCTDDALANATPESIARSYGLEPSDVASDITRQQLVRSQG